MEGRIRPRIEPATPGLKPKPPLFLLSPKQRSAPVTPLRNSVRATTASTPTFNTPHRKAVSFGKPKIDTKWKKDLITEFNLSVPRMFEYRTSYVRSLKELSSKRDNMSIADFWRRDQKLKFINKFQLGSLLRKKLARSPMYELRLIARLSQPASPFQMDRRTSLLIQERRSVKDIKLMNNNEDPWTYTRPSNAVANPTVRRMSIDQWASHPIYRPTSVAETRSRQEVKGDRKETLDAFIEAIEVEEHKAATAAREL